MRKERRLKLIQEAIEETRASFAKLEEKHNLQTPMQALILATKHADIYQNFYNDIVNAMEMP